MKYLDKFMAWVKKRKTWVVLLIGIGIGYVFHGPISLLFKGIGGIIS